jgi:hypothetical protein
MQNALGGQKKGRMKMNRLLNTLAAALLLMGTSALAQDFNTPLGPSELSNVGGDPSNIAEITQDGLGHFASITQEGILLQAAISQIGSDHQARISQQGNHLLAAITQSGTANIAEITQVGAFMRASIIQSGSNNFASVMQRN